MPVSLSEWRVRIGKFRCRGRKEYDYNYFWRKLDHLIKRNKRAESPKENNTPKCNTSSPNGSSNVAKSSGGASAYEVDLKGPSCDINNSRGDVNSPSKKDTSDSEAFCAENSGSSTAKETNPVPDSTDVKNLATQPCAEDELDNRYITIHQILISNKKSAGYPSNYTQGSKTDQSDVSIIEANNHSPAAVANGPVLSMESIRPDKEETSNSAPSGIGDQSSGLSPKPRQDTTRNAEQTTPIEKVKKCRGSQSYPVLGSGPTSVEADAIKDIDCPDMTNTLLLRSGDVELNPGPNDTVPIIDEQHEDEGQSDIMIQEAIRNGTAPWNRSRIMVIGPSGVGKTSLIRRLTGQKFNPEEKSTQGVEQNVVTKSAVSSWVLVNDTRTAKCDIIQSIATMDPNFGSNKSYSTGREENRSDPEITGTNRSTLRKRTMSEATKDNVLMTGDAARKIAKISQGITRKEITKVKSSQLDITYSMWDFGGQENYYTTHPLFLSWRSLYILVIPLHLELSDKAPREEDAQKQLKGSAVRTHRTILDLIHFWLMSVYTHAVPDSNLDSRYEPKILLIGTFAGDGGPLINEEKVTAKFQELKDRLGSNPYWKQVLSPMFGIDNRFSEHSKVNTIQDRIDGLIQDLEYMKVCKPIKWRPFLTEIEDSDQNTLTLTEARSRMTIWGINDVKEVYAVLKFYHDLGHLIYHQGCDLIVLKPQFLNSIISNIITVNDDKKML